MKKILLVAILPLLMATVARAEEKTFSGTPQNEIIYRTNLGRAADVKLLLDKGVSPNLTNDENVPLLALAAARKDPEGVNIMKTLLDAGADINAADSYGQSALFYAARQGNDKAVMFLLEHGANYYLTDHNGNVARNIAHKEGYGNILTDMDNFVKKQSEQVQQQYNAYNNQLKERYEAERKAAEELENQQAAEDAQKAEEARKAIEEAQARTKEQREQQQQEIAAIRQKQQEERQAIIDKRNALSYEEDMEALAFHTCAFQYWNYCKTAGQTTEITGNELDIAIDSHEQQILELMKMLPAKYTLPQSYINGIISRAKRRIFVELQRMPSKTYRFEHGVGKMEDMNERCENVAKFWNNRNVQAIQPEPESASGGQSYGNPQPANRRAAKRRRHRRR